MHPVHKEEQRRARTKALQKRFERFEHVAYVDVADYPGRDAMIVVIVNRQGDFICSGSVRTTVSKVGEEAAIAVAMMASTKLKYVVSDSKSAISNYAKRRVSPDAATILHSGPLLRGRYEKKIARKFARFAANVAERR